MNKSIFSKNKLKSARLLVAFLLMTCSTQHLYADSFWVDGIYYYTTSNNTVGVTSLGSGYRSVINIPNEVEHYGVMYSVTSIRDNAFADCNYLTSVTIPNSVTKIGEYAFSGCI